MRIQFLLVIAGFFTNSALFSQAAGLDTSFDAGNAAGSSIESITLQPDGKIIVTGHFDSRIVRLHSNGAVDESFRRPELWAAVLSDLALTPDGKLIVVGDFATFHGITANRMVRLHSNGEVDETFNIGTGPNNFITGVALQPDGKILIVGAFTTFNGTPRGGIARLHADGSLDTSFNPGAGAAFTNGISGQVFGLHLQADGKILINGFFNIYDGKTATFSARVNTDGSYDDSFTPPRLAGGAGSIHTVDVFRTLPDGKILMGGHFGTVNGVKRGCIVRLNQDGTVDSGFNPPQGAQVFWGTKVADICPLPDGKMLVGGIFATYDNVDRRNFVRIHADGTLDTSFDPGTGFVLTGNNPNVSDIVLQPDGKILVGGFFTHYNGVERRFVARLNGETISSVESIRSNSSVLAYPNPATDHITLENSTPGATLRLFDMTGREVGRHQIKQSQTTIPVSHLPKGLYFIREDEGQAVKVRKE